MRKSISNIKRMEIYMADLPLSSGSVQMGKRPVLIVQNDVGNMKSPTVVVVPLTTAEKSGKLFMSKFRHLLVFQKNQSHYASRL